MERTFAQDRPCIERKYHPEQYNSFAAWESSGWTYDESTGLSDTEIRSRLKELYETTRGQSHARIKAAAVSLVLENTRLKVCEQDYFPGVSCWHKDIRYEMLNHWNDEVFAAMDPADREYLKRTHEAGASQVWADFDHSVPDWGALRELGFPGIRRRAQRARQAREAQAPLTPAQQDYFDSIDVVYGAILSCMKRLQALCEGQRGEKARRMGACLAALQQGAPTDSYQLMMLIYLYFFLCEYVGCLQVRSYGGNLDQLLHPTIERDLACGRYSSEEIDELLRYFLMQVSAIGNYWNQPLYLGGTGKDGESLVNETTYRILRVYDELDIYNPKIHIKTNTNTPEKLLRVALDMIRRKNASLMFVGEPNIMRAMMGAGYTEEEARTADVKGCYEFSARGREVSTAPFYMNLLKPVELALFDGCDAASGVRIGPATGLDFATFDDFYGAYVAQTVDILENTMRVVDAMEARLDHINPTPIFSATIQTSLDRMTDAYAFGSKYNNSSVVVGSLGSAVDSLMCVRHFVYETGEATLEDFRRAARDNWEGQEALRARVLAFGGRYGNHDPKADLYARSIAGFVGALIMRRPNARGGFWKDELHSARMFLNFGPVTAATPDGRRRGEELSKNLSPVIGMDRRGVTALILSATQIDFSRHLDGGALDVMLHPSAVAGEEGMDALLTVLRTYIGAGGNGIQFNISDARVLREAQENPDKYRNLQIRVCGWNAYFVDMPKNEQDAYILRAENIQ